ncbi:aldose 1-epimerase [Clostridia bacterium]|nr:aldose 1-epimerase [Clostridia bacterium]
MITQRSMGALADGTDVTCYRLTNASGAYCEISTLGGCLMSIVVPDGRGVPSDVLIGYDTLEGLLHCSGYMGYLIGRYANRIGGAAFTLNGKAYTLAKNDGENHLHGGLQGFDKKVWRAQAQGDALRLSIDSPDGEEGYPGALAVQVTYTFSDANAVRIAYEATGDADTVINLTNHAYFNLSGPDAGTVAEETIQIHADLLTEVSSAACIPTGRLVPVDGTPFDLRTARNIGEGLSHQDTDAQMRYGNGYDHNFVLRGWDGTLRQAAVLTDSAAGRRMEVWTDQPGVQFYSGNGIGGDVPGKAGKPYTRRQGLCLETQRFPDSVHQENFPSCVLKKGEKYETVTEYRFFVG